MTFRPKQIYSLIPKKGPSCKTIVVIILHTSGLDQKASQADISTSSSITLKIRLSWVPPDPRIIASFHLTRTRTRYATDFHLFSKNLLRIYNRCHAGSYWGAIIESDWLTMTGEPPCDPKISVIFVLAFVVPVTTSTNWTKLQLQNPNIRIMTNCSQRTSNS